MFKEAGEDGGGVCEVRGSGSGKHIYGIVPVLVEMVYRLLVRC